MEDKKRKKEIILSGEEVQAEILRIQARLSKETNKQDVEDNRIKEEKRREYMRRMNDKECLRGEGKVEQKRDQNIKRPISAGIYLSQNERILNSHKKKLEFWKRQEEIFMNKVGPRKKEGILEGEGGRWRMKKEIEDVLEVIKTNQERLGEKCWEINLRNNDECVREFLVILISILN